MSTATLAGTRLAGPGGVKRVEDPAAGQTGVPSNPLHVLVHAGRRSSSPQAPPTGGLPCA
jgi:hypothetical protein